MKGAKWSEDRGILLSLKRLLQDRATYGYKRITAMYNRERTELGLPVYNRKRIYRIMKAHGLLLPSSVQRRGLGVKGTGQIITKDSDRRWCSDCFEVHCFNGEKVYVSFVLDCHDRELISFVAFARPLGAGDIKDLMILAVERRFGGTLRTKREIEFLTDRGSIYRAYEVQQLARRLGLKSCFTRAYSPQSNGMAEAFVKTIKRDYVYVRDCVSADRTLKLLGAWMEDYNTKAPHSGLGMRSPLEYRKSKERSCEGNNFNRELEARSSLKPYKYLKKGFCLYKGFKI